MTIKMHIFRKKKKKKNIYIKKMIKYYEFEIFARKYGTKVINRPSMRFLYKKSSKMFLTRTVLFVNRC